MAINVRRSSDQYYGIGAFVLTLGIVALSGLGPRMPTAENLLPYGYLWDLA